MTEAAKAAIPAPDWNELVTRERATEIAERLTGILFKDKPDQVEHHLDRADLIAFAIVAFEAGATWESGR